MKIGKVLVKALAFAGVLTISGMLVSCNQAQTGEKNEKVVRVFNCGAYIAKGMVQKFEQESGMKVIYEEFDTNETMYSKLKQGGTNYDILIPSDYMIVKLLKENRLQKINTAKLVHFKDLDKNLLHKSFDPDQEYTVPYMWGTLGIAYDKNVVKKPVDSFNILWDKEYQRNVFMMDSMRDTMGVALKHLGYSMNTTDPGEITAAREALIRQKKDGIFLALTLDDVRDKMVAEEAALAVCYSGEGDYMQEENSNIGYALPNEGTNIWFDCMVIPTEANNVDGAYQFIDFMCREENALDNALATGYSTPSKKAWKKLPENIRSDKTKYPDKDYLRKCEAYTDVGSALQLYSDAWTEYQVTK